MIFEKSTPPPVDRMFCLLSLEYLPHIAVSRVFTGGGSACFSLQLICLVKLHTESSSLVGVGTIKYPLMAPHGSSHPASGSPLPLCVSIVRLRFICSVCFSLAAWISSDVCCLFHLSVGRFGESSCRGQPSLESCRMWKL